MPTGNKTSNEIASLSTLCAYAAIDHIFEPDKTLLSKAYKHGILPVRVIEDIYCHWIDKAIELREKALEPTRQHCKRAARAMDKAQYDYQTVRLNAVLNNPGRPLAEGESPDEVVTQYKRKFAFQERVYTGAVNITLLAECEQNKKLRGYFLDILSTDERHAIAWQTQTNHIEEAETRFSLEVNPFTKIKTGEIDESAV